MDFSSLLTFQLNPLQKEILRELVVGGEFLISVQAGWGSGKSTALVLAVLLWSQLRKGKGEASLLVTDTLSRYKQVLHPALQKILLPLGWENYPSEGRWTNGDHTIWTRAYFRPGTENSSSNSLEGLNVSFAVLDEAQAFRDSEVYQKMIGRIRSMTDQGQPKIICAGLPQWGAWWVEEAERSAGKVIKATSHVNSANLPKAWFEAVKSLPEAERLAMIENLPQPPKGSVYSEFSPTTNIVKGWVYNREHKSYITIDWGFQKPSLSIITHDPTLPDNKGGFGVDVVHRELNPANCTVPSMIKLILDFACPRDLAHLYPPTHILLDGGSCDKAGQARSDQTGIENVRVLKKPVSEGGLELPLRFTTDSIRVDIMNGVRRLKKLFEDGKIKLTEDLWSEGLRKSQGNSLAKAISSYRWASENKDIPKKDGTEDPLDALRYFVLNFRWRDDSTLGVGVSVPHPSAKKQESTLYNKVALPVTPKSSSPMGSFSSGGNRKFSF